ncbi:MAG: rhomboid family intramembrane serine protease [Rikenellaceae bacterium]|nr:rhomboid family intramembrane serine protease [Rikenellaceae bacterium]
MNSYFRTPSVTLNLIIVNVLFYLVQTLLPFGNEMSWKLALYSSHSHHFHVYQLIIYMFLHGGTTHLFFNMFGLWMFGRQLEYDLGARRFLTYYLICGVGAGLIQLLVSHFDPLMWNVPTVGASGAIFGILLAFGVLHPNAMIMLIIPPIPMRAKYFVIIYGVLELLLGVFSTSSSVAHFAHVGGMLWGWLLLRLWRVRRII